MRLKPRLRLRHLLAGVVWLGINFAMVRTFLLSDRASTSWFAELDAIAIGITFLVVNVIVFALFVLIRSAAR